MVSRPSQLAAEFRVVAHLLPARLELVEGRDQRLRHVATAEGTEVGAHVARRLDERPHPCVVLDPRSGFER